MDISIREYCKIYLLLLLLVIVDATSSNTNETSNEHRQSRVTGRIVKIYSGTRPDPVTCAGEGFQADPHNCAIFYRCMKSGNGKYSVFKFQCGPGTVYDPETEVCNHPHSTKRSECGGILPPPVEDRISNNEIEDIRQEVPSPITTSKPNYTNKPETDKSTFAFTTTKSPITISSSTKRQVPDLSSIFTSLSPWGSSLGVANIDHTVSPLILPPTIATQNQQYNDVPKNVPPPNIPQTSRQDNICTSDGFMGDSEDCRKFYRCVANQRGTYTRFEFSCSESTVWDDDTQSCNHAWAVKRSRCGRSGQQNNQISNESNKPTAEGSKVDPNLKAKTIQQQLQISYGSKVTQSQTQISNGSVVQNQTQINYGDRTNPKQGSRATQNQTQISHGSATSQSQTQIDYSDKGVQTQLQIDHSQQSSQSQIQIHESTTRGTSTSVAQVDTQGNQCTRSGFMGDTNDCKKFYRCIDNGRGSFMKFEFSCGEGTVWDQSIEACNHAWAVKECGGKGSTGSTSTTYSSTSTPKTTQSSTTASTENYQTTPAAIVTEDNEDDGYGQPNQNPTTQSSTTIGPTTTVTFVSSTPSSKGECQTSGFIGDLNDCKIFYRCVENGRGAFTKYEFKCGEGTVWDPDLEACNHAWAVKKCGGSASPDKVETTTGKQTTAYTDQTTQSTVIIHSSTERPNIDYDDSGYESGNNVFTTTTTSTTPTSRPSSEQSSGSICQSSGFIGDANDCKKFYRCVDNGNGGYTRYEFSCGEGTVWDSQIDACNHAWAVKNCGGAGSIDSVHETTSQSKPTTSHDIITSSSTETVESNVSPTSGPSTTSTTTTTSGPLPASDDCTRSGFMGDRKDCKKFYRCVDNGNGSYTKYEFSCGEGTVWDQKIEACNHAWAVEKCGGNVESSSEHHETSTQHHNTINDEIDDGYPSNQDIGQTSTQSSTTGVTTEASKIPSNDNNCVSSGFIGDKNDCKKFYRCVDDGKNGYIRYEFSCGEGTLWDQSIEACNHAWAVKDCGQAGNNTQHVASETTTQVTASSTTEDQVYPQSTEKTTTTLMVSSKPDDQSDICLTEGFKGDRNDCKKFYRCVDNGRGGFTKYEFACGDGTLWNQEILACDHTSSNKNCGGTSVGSSTQNSYSEQDEMQTEATTMSSSSILGNNNDYSTQKPPVSSSVCTSEGFYGDMNDCKKFYRCVDNGKGGYTKYDFTCGDGTVWNQEIQACDHESNNKNCSTRPASGTQTTATPGAGNDFSSSPSTESQYSTEMAGTSSTSSSSSSSSYNCDSEGFFAHPDDCKKFIRCVSNDKGGYTRYEFACGEGTIWVQDLLACDHDTGDANCKSQSTNKPVASNENQPTTTERHEVDATSTKPQITDIQEDEYDNGGSNKPTEDSDECSSEGFHANKNDCRQFYRCVDNGQGGYTKYDFTCGEGTAWDSEVQTCNHIDQVKSCQGSSSQPVMHEENNAQTTASSGSSNSQATESTSASNTQTTESTSTSKTTTTASNQGSTNENKNTCDSEGYFGDKQDCKKFYRCVDNGKGGYTKYDFTCGEGTIWDQDITTCNHPQDVVNPSCNQQDGSTTSTTSSSASGGSSEATTTTEGTDSSQTTSSTQSTTSTQSSGNCSQGEETDKPKNQNVTCTKAGYFANPNDCKKFYRCVDWDGDGKRFSVYHFDCGEGTIWDPAVETCNHEESVYPPRDCSGTQSQSENQPSTEQTTTSQQESTTTEKSSTTEASTTQTTQSTTSEPSTTEQSTSQASTTQQSSSSEQTTTETSTTSEQTTQQPSTSEQTTTQQSTTSEQTTTQQSTTSEQTTQEFTTSEQTTTQSTTSEQTTTQSTTTEETTTQQSTTSEQTTEQSTSSEQTTTQQSSTSEQTTTQQSTTSEQTTTEQTTTQESTTSEQTTQESTTSEQTTQESTTSEQTTQESTTSEQTTQESTTSEQTTQESTTEQSTTQQSTTSDSTTESTTTEQSTTQQSTTAEQTEQSTTEESTTSESTTTQESTTAQSTTDSQDNSTTESSTTEQTSESKCPETEDDQNLFVCPTSFRRHPKYCNLFYQCDEEDDTHDVKIAVFTCPNNTIYDESQTRCVEEKKADKKCDGQIAQKRRFKRFDMDYKEPIVVTKDSYACKSAGYFSFEKDSECSPAFLKCKTDKNKKVKGLVYQCPSGYVYWSISKRCEPVNRVKDCKRSHNNWTGRWEIPVERRNVARP